MVGHDRFEHPWCQNPDGGWEMDLRARLDGTDEKNFNDDMKHRNSAYLDRVSVFEPQSSPNMTHIFSNLLHSMTALASM